jgi:hypothetical protein
LLVSDSSKKVGIRIRTTRWVHCRLWRRRRRRRRGGGRKIFCHGINKLNISLVCKSGIDQ